MCFIRIKDIFEKDNYLFSIAITSALKPYTMETSLIFDREMRRLLKSETSETLTYVQEQFTHSKFTSYNGFFYDFLFGYGIHSFNSIPEGSTGDYMPYVNCKDDNIFGEAEGCTDLSDKPLSLAKCQTLIVRYIVEHLKRLDVSVLKEWKELQRVH